MYETGWKTVRERVLNRELASVSNLLAIAKDEEFEFMQSFQLFTNDIKAMESDVKSYGDSFDNYDTFERDLFDFLVGLTASKLPAAESSIITLVWLKVLKHQNTVD